jgi:hypothetical protein
MEVKLAQLGIVQSEGMVGQDTLKLAEWSTRASGQVRDKLRVGDGIDVGQVHAEFGRQVVLAVEEDAPDPQCFGNLALDPFKPGWPCPPKQSRQA